MAPPEYGDNPQQQALIKLLLQDNNELEQRQDLVYDRRDMGNDDAAPLPTIDWQSRPSKAMASAATDADKADELKLVMQFSNAIPKASHRSDTWNRRIIDFYLVYCQFMAMYTSIQVEDYFIVEVLVKYAIPYLVTRAIKTKGIDSERIKSRTLITWMDGLINGIWQYAHQSRNDRTSAAKEVLFKHGLARRIRAKVDQLIRVLGLSKLLRTKHILDTPDLHLIIDSALFDTRFSPGNRFAVIQFIMSWCIILYTGLRPMSLAASNKRYRESGFFMRLKNIKIHTNASSDWTVTVNATHLKGHVVGLDHKDLTFQLRCVKKTHNIMFCAATWVVLYLWLRGALPQYKTLNDLWMTTDTELVIQPSMGDEPFLLAAKEGGKGLVEGRAASAEQISKTLGYHAHKIFMFGITSYALRRGLGNLLAHQIGDSHAAVVLGHKDAESVFNKHYSRGTADIDVVGLVTREADVQPDKPGMPKDLADLSDAAFEKLWACFLPNGMRKRNKQNANKLFNGIATGEFKLKMDVDPTDVAKYHTEAIDAIQALGKAWKARKRDERKNIADHFLINLNSRRLDTVQDRDNAAKTLRSMNEAAIRRLVAAIPNDTAQHDIMSQAEMDSTVENAFLQETDELGDVVDEYGRTNPLPRAVLNKKFATRFELDEMEATFSKPFVALDEQEQQEESEQALVIDGGEGTDNGLDDDNDAADVLSDDIIAVRHEFMELVATPILCMRDGRPIPGQEGVPSCCNRTFKELNQYKEHMRWVHSEWNEFVNNAIVNSKWKCAPCNESFKQRAKFIEHALEHCTEKERNQAWYAPVKEHLENHSADAKMRRKRLRDERETGSEALAQAVLPDDMPGKARETLVWGLGLLPSKADARAQLVEARKELAVLEAAHSVLSTDAMDLLDFDVDEALSTLAYSIM